MASSPKTAQHPYRAYKATPEMRAWRVKVLVAICIIVAFAVIGAVAIVLTHAAPADAGKAGTTPATTTKSAE
jgi:hypothetical protein